MLVMRKRRVGVTARSRQIEGNQATGLLQIATEMAAPLEFRTPMGTEAESQPSADGSMATMAQRTGNWLETGGRQRQPACGSKELDSPPFPFPPPGESRGGRVPPTPRHVTRQPTPLARPVLRLPPQEGFQSATAEIPLAHPPIGLRRKELQWSPGSSANPDISRPPHLRQNSRRTPGRAGGSVSGVSPLMACGSKESEF